MKFSTREDVYSPVSQVYARLSDFEAFAQMLQGHGAKVTRLDVLPMPSVGNSWDIEFQYRGKTRQITATVNELNPNEDIRIKITSDGIDGILDVQLVEQSKERTRMKVAIDLRPKNLSTRLIIQSMKLAKSSLTNKYRARVAGYARTLEKAA